MDTLLKKIINETVNQRFPEMSTESRDLLCTIITRREMEKGELLLKEGQVSRHFVIVGKGMVRQFYYKNGKDVTEHFSLESDVVICIESILLQQPTRLMIEALEAGTLYMIPADQFLKLSKESWEINMFYRKMLEFSLILSQKKADSWRFETARERYLRLMADQPEVVQRAPLAHIASYLLMTPETLSRVRATALQDEAR
ncbi:MAG TPA: Crp/Fnr family transcriptional regulator [Candidatus Bacteroides intestinavium]|uniref:Crp/Fnr family transcriptional regulator n=1 Tax=Candidatus Bacteroides intestinavium TaxID=2838469 RepID=A0A9D2HRX8_9BACE|nr:Crp/Fnr family transcriptional regulator [Candidatus Bacteroides intestinavium]